LCAIVTALMALNLEQAVFDLMGGLQRREGPGERVIDETYGVVVNITFFSWLAVLPLLIAYGFAIWRVESARR
jgi:Trk-type K+ transport system membrane component